MAKQSAEGANSLAPLGARATATQHRRAPGRGPAGRRRGIVEPVGTCPRITPITAVGGIVESVPIRSTTAANLRFSGCFPSLTRLAVNELRSGGARRNEPFRLSEPSAVSAPPRESIPSPVSVAASSAIFRISVDRRASAVSPALVAAQPLRAIRGVPSHPRPAPHPTMPTARIPGAGTVRPAAATSRLLLRARSLAH